MALALAKEVIQCSTCDAPLSEEPLYMCTVVQCPKYGEIYCEDCGKMAHKRQNHKFNTSRWGGNTKKVKPMTKGIQGGMNKLNGALGAHEENQRVGIRQGTIGSMTSALVTIALESGGSGLLGTTTDIAKEYLGGGEGAVYAAVALGAFETVFHTARFINGDIETWGEYGYHLAKGWVAAGGLCAGNVIGGAIGGAIGGMVGGPLGAFIGKIIGGMAGGLIGAKLTRSGFDAFFKNDQQQIKRAELIKEALNLFGYASADDLENENIFNERELKKKYKDLAKRYHPDRKGGSAESFHTVTASFGVLISLLKKSDKSDAIKKVKEIQKLRSIAWK